MQRQWNAILQIRSSRLTGCVRLEGVPLIDALQVAVLEDPGATAGVAQGIFQRLLLRISGSSGAIRSVVCNGPQGRSCMGYQAPDCRCLLIAVTGQNRLRPEIAAEMRDWNRGGPGEDLVLPVLPAGSDPRTVLGRGLDRTNVVFHHGHIDDTVDTLVQQTGVGGAQRRLFISYRRSQTRDLADQLFDAFSRAGFQVFLDRFSGTPGRLFPDELGEEIVDKGVVLVLESAGIERSPWTLAEVGFAFLFQIGLLALNVDNAPRFALIGSRDRIAMNRTDRGDLTPSDLAEVVRFVRRAYPRQMLGRRLFLEALLHMGLGRHGLVPQPVGGGIFGVESRGTKYVIGLAERAPAVSDLRRLSSAVTATGGACPIVLGPHQFLAPTRRQDLYWLLRTAKAHVMGEGEITRKCMAIAQGRLNP